MSNKKKIKKKKKGVVVNKDRSKYRYLPREGNTEKVLGIDFYNSLISLLLKIKKDKRRLDLRKAWKPEDYLLYIDFKRNFDNYEKVNNKLILMLVGTEYNSYYLRYLYVWDIPISMLESLSINSKYNGDFNEVKKLKDSMEKVVNELNTILNNLKTHIENKN